MNLKIKEEKNSGVTLLALVITIILLLIIATITIKIGSDQIKNAHLQSYKTNMLLIEAKAKEYVENASHELGIKPEDATQEMKDKSQAELTGEGKGTKVNSSDSISSKLTSIGISSSDIDAGNVYQLSTADIEKIGINGEKSDEENGYYVLLYNIPEATVKVYNTKGFNAGNAGVKYCLDDIRDIDEVE